MSDSPETGHKFKKDKSLNQTSPHLQTLDIVVHLALVQLVDQVALASVLPVLLQGIEHDATQLLDIMLLPYWKENKIT